MKKTFSRCIASIERYQPIPNIKGKSASTHQKQSSKEDLPFLTKPTNVAGKTCVFLICNKEEGCVLKVCLLCSRKKKKDGPINILHGCLSLFMSLDFHASNNTVSELLSHLCGKQKSILCPLATAHLQSVTSHMLPPQLWYHWPSLPYFCLQESGLHLIPWDSLPRY